MPEKSIAFLRRQQGKRYPKCDSCRKAGQRKIEIQHGKDRGITSDCYNIVLQRAYPPRLSRQLSGEFRCHFASKLLSVACAGVLLQIAPAIAQNQRNLILFVPDGLRPHSVTPETAPTLAAIRDKGVNFANPHALFPTFTMANASGMATGHFLGDTGAFSNTIYTAYPVPTAGGSVTPFIENDPILGDIDAHFSGNFVDEDTILFAARRQGFSTAAIGKLGPTLMFDHTERTGEATVTIDDSTGSKQGIPLSQEMQDALKAAGLPLVAPSRKDTPGDNSNAGNFEKPGTLVANVVQQKYFADVAAKVVLPMFKARNKPFVLVFWSRDPDGTQHNQGDSHLKVYARHQRTNLARLHQECRRQSRGSAQGTGRARPCRNNRYSSSQPTMGSRQFRRKAKRAQPRRRVTRTSRQACCRPDSSD